MRALGMPRVIALILTYNRKDLLRQCLEAVTAQTRPCDDVIVLDNASTDGTPDMLQREWAGKTTVHVLSRNIGAAGGFSAGFRLAYAMGADFIWVMDDDVIPAEDALERLLAAEETLASHGVERAFVASLPRTPDGELTNIPDVDTRLNKAAYKRYPEMLAHKMVAVRRSTFVSILLPRETLAVHGLPIASMFIWGEDTEYTRRVTKRHSGYLVGDSHVVHARSIAGLPRIEMEVDPVRIEWHSYYVRNLIYNYGRLVGPKDVLFLFRSRIRQIFRLIIQREVKKAWIIARGLLWYLSFKPAIEGAEAPISALGVSSTLLQQSIIDAAEHHDRTFATVN